MKYFKLDKEEQEILDSVERGEWVSVKNLAKAKKELMEAARNTTNKLKNINIRLSEKDLHKLKAKAAEEGIPYQTLASSLIHDLGYGQVLPLPLVQRVDISVVLNVLFQTPTSSIVPANWPPPCVYLPIVKPV